MQIHIVADVGWAILNYYLCTGDDTFMKDYGLEMLFEVARYWSDRVETDGDRYVINTVTGTDEHHPYVNNNAYTNYEVCYVLQNALRLFRRFKPEINALTDRIELTQDEAEQWDAIARKLYLPMDKATGMIPQFDNYFELNRGLETTGGSSSKSFQMKQSGLYHKSQVIKQPDVLLLFSYLNLEFDKEVYARNWDYYQARCESASSLSYSVHAICAADMSLPDTAYSYFLKTARLDMDDEHDCAWQGVHTACAAGAWLAAVRGIAGVVYHEDGIELHPHMIPWWKSLSCSVVWHGQTVALKLDNEQMTVSSDTSNSKAVPLRFFGRTEELKPGGEISFPVSLTDRADFRFC
jgi:trehalose/maltose hydrolase-like predicted phosphorylase